MTIEQIVGISPKELAAMSDEQLHAYFAPFLAHTRPENGKTFSKKAETKSVERTKANHNTNLLIEQMMKNNPELAKMAKEKGLM